MRHKRFDDPDSMWSDPGSTFGIRDRWTTRHLCGLWLTAGHNGRERPDYTKFTVPESESPWKVYAQTPHPVVKDHWQMTLVTSGTASSVALAKEAAERAARSWKGDR